MTGSLKQLGSPIYTQPASISFWQLSLPLETTTSLLCQQDTNTPHISLRLNRKFDLWLGVGDIIDCWYIGIFSSYRQIIVIEKNTFGNYQKIVHPILSDKLNWKHIYINKKQSISYHRWIWNRPWKQCTNLSGNTCRTSRIVKYVHSFHCDLL